MPFLVVPIFWRPRYRSITASSFLWYGMMRWALDEILSRVGSTPRLVSISISSSRTFGSITQPEAITGVQSGYITPLGMSESANFSLPTTMVCPALFPP